MGPVPCVLAVKVGKLTHRTGKATRRGDAATCKAECSGDPELTAARVLCSGSPSGSRGGGVPHVVGWLGLTGSLRSAWQFYTAPPQVLSPGKHVVTYGSLRFPARVKYI